MKTNTARRVPRLSNMTDDKPEAFTADIQLTRINGDVTLCVDGEPIEIIDDTGGGYWCAECDIEFNTREERQDHVFEVHLS